VGLTLFEWSAYELPRQEFNPRVLAIRAHDGFAHVFNLVPGSDTHRAFLVALRALNANFHKLRESVFHNPLADTKAQNPFKW
jgi:hypothetical protein